MPRSGGLKPLQNTHEYTHKLIQTEGRRGLDGKLRHIYRAHIHIGAQRTHVYIHGDLHGHAPPATLQTGKKRQAYQGGVGRSPTIFFFFLFFIIFLKK